MTQKVSGDSDSTKLGGQKGEFFKYHGIENYPL